MNKKTITISILCIVCIIFIGAISFAVNHLDKKAYVSENMIAQDLFSNSKLDKTKPTLVFFHSERCGYCVRFAPIFEKLSKEYNKTFNFVTLDVDNPKNFDLARGNVVELPSVFIFDTSIGNKVQIPMAELFSENALRYELDRYTRIRSFIDLDKAEKDFEKQINKK